MKKLLLLLLAAAAFSGAQAQTGISAAGTAPDAAAMMDVIATDKGFMVPRVALTALNAAGPVTGLSATSTSLLVYNTASAGIVPNDVTPGFYYWNNATTSWIRILSGAANLTAGNDIDFGTSAANSIDVEPILNFVHTISAPAANNLNLNAASGNAIIVNFNNGTTGATQTFRIGDGAGGADVFNVAANGNFYAANNGQVVGNLNLTGTTKTLFVAGIRGGNTFNTVAPTIANSNIMYADNASGAVYSLPAAAAVSTLTSNATGQLSWASSTGTGIQGYWTRTLTNLYNTNLSDNVGIGSTAPTSTLKIEGSLAPKYVSTAANPYNVAQTDYYVNYNTSGGVVNLPNSGTGIPGRLLNIKNTTSGTVTVNAVGGELIDGSASYILNANNSLQLINNGTATGAVTTWNVMEVSLTGGLLASGFAAPAANSVTISAPTAGSATTAIRSDATLQLSQAIVPTWTGTHTFSNAAAIRSSNGTVALPAIAFTASTGTGLSSPAVNVLAFSTAGAERARIDATGNFGIGVTPSGTYKLQVSGKLLTSGIDENSDVRLKQNINPIYDALSKVTQMRGVTYNWRTEEFPERNFEKDMQFGLIAQELEKVIPELVTTDGDGYKAIEYSHLVPVLIEAIKELKTENNILKTENSTTNSKLSIVNQQLSILNTRMSALENNVEVKTNKAEK